MSRSLIKAIMYFFLFTLVDIVIIEYYWFSVLKYNEYTPFYETFVNVYQIVYYMVLIPGILIINYMENKNWRTLMYTVLLVYFGSLDVFYFLLLNRQMPVFLPWLWGGVTRTFVYTMSIVSIGLIGFLEIEDYMY